MHLRKQSQGHTFDFVVRKTLRNRVNNLLGQALDMYQSQKFEDGTSCYKGGYKQCAYY
jgi:hypothetical protein